MTSYPPDGGGDPQRGPGDQGQPYGGPPQQPYPQQPYPQQPYPQQPYPQQPHPGQPYPGQPYPGQPYPGQSYPGQPYPQQPPYPPPPGYPPYPPGGFADPDDPLVATDFDQWLRKSFGVVGRSWQPLLLITLAGYLPSIALVALLNALVRNGAGVTPIVLVSVLAFVVLVATSLIGQGMSVYYVGHDAAGIPIRVGEAFRFGARRALPLLGWGILIGLMILVGYVLLFLPGLYVALVSGATLLGVVTVERGAIGRCFGLFNRRFWATTGRMLLYAVLVGIWFSLVVLLQVAAFGEDQALGQIVVQVLAVPVGVLTVGVSVVTYAELRHHEAPGMVGTPGLVAELRR